MKFLRDLRLFYYWLVVGAVGTASVGLVVGSLFWATVRVASSDERQIFQNLLFYLYDEDMEAALQTIHPSIHGEFTGSRADQLMRVDRYISYQYSTVKYNLSSGTWDLQGVIITASGCKSSFTAGVIGDLVYHFNLRPLCLKP